VIFSGTSPNGGASLKVLVNPVVDLLWLGGLLIGLGTLIAIWPDPHVARRLARRYGRGAARQRALRCSASSF